MVLPPRLSSTPCGAGPAPTLLLDEADAIFGPDRREVRGLRAILNSGNRAGSPVLRVKLDGRRREVEAFDVFARRSWPASETYRLPSPTNDPDPDATPPAGRGVERFRQREAEADAAGIRLDVRSVTLADRYPSVPDELPDGRPTAGRCCWRSRTPLAARGVAGAPGGRRALGRPACDHHDWRPASGRPPDAFGADEQLTTTVLLARLQPWTMRPGATGTQADDRRALARLLAPFGVHPGTGAMATPHCAATSPRT